MDRCLYNCKAHLRLFCLATTHTHTYTHTYTRTHARTRARMHLLPPHTHTEEDLPELTISASGYLPLDFKKESVNKILYILYQ